MRQLWTHVAVSFCTLPSCGVAATALHGPSRWGTSQFTPTATLCNEVGGKGAARYVKQCTQGVVWRDVLLTEAIVGLAAWLASRGIPAPRYRCLNMVVPTYRCDPAALARFAALTTSPAAQASVHILLVVDNPGAPSLPAVRALQDWSHNHLVNVYEQPPNMGASQARNAGMAQSFGDWTVLLDDDVLPEPDILDAYLGGILRYPRARILVGLTRLPPPTTLLQSALVVSQLAFFFTIAQRCKHPPWGITANLCVPGRTSNSIWFSKAYPKTGGGEDVDFCLRHKAAAAGQGVGEAEREGVLVAVPEAVATHPFWARPMKQVAGWARGDVVCLTALPHSTFRAAPNWAETLSLLLAALLCHGPSSTTLLLLAQCAAVLAACELLFGLATYLPLTYRLSPVVSAARGPVPGQAAAAGTPHAATTGAAAAAAAEPADPTEPGMASTKAADVVPLSVAHCVAVAAMALMPALLQDAVRLQYKLVHAHPTHLCLHFDWMDGQAEHKVVTQFSLLLRNLAWWPLLGCVLGRTVLPGWALAGALLLLAGAMVTLYRAQTTDHAALLKREQLARLTPVPGVSGPGPDGAVPFVVLAYQRTGSNMLCGMLHNHPQVLMHNEAFNEAKVFSYHEGLLTAAQGWHWDVCARDRDPQAFLVHLMSRRYTVRAPATSASSNSSLTPSSSNGSCTSDMCSSGDSASNGASAASTADSHRTGNASHEDASCAGGAGGGNNSGSNASNGVSTGTNTSGLGNSAGNASLGDTGSTAQGSANGSRASVSCNASFSSSAPAAASRSGAPCVGGGCCAASSSVAAGMPPTKGHKPAPKAVGFKLFPEHWRPGATCALFQRLAADPAVKKIILRRDNVLAVYVSKLRADKTGHYLGKSLDGVAVDVEPAAFQAFAEHYDQVYAYYDSLLKGQDESSVLRVTYEQLTEGNDSNGRNATMRHIHAFLGLNASHMAKPLGITTKQSTTPLRAAVNNWEELRFAFARTSLARCFGDLPGSG